jgi:cytochrome P450
VTSSNTLLDLLSSDPQKNYYQLLREESEAIFVTEDDWKSSASLLKLHRLDSTIRETLRRHPILLRGLSRQVVPKEGVTLPNGQNIAQGAWIGFPLQGIHNDSRYYDKPEVYNPFRFLATETAKKSMLVTTSETFLPFGYSKHSWYVILSPEMAMNIDQIC